MLEGKARVQCLNDISWEYKQSQPDKAIEYATEAIKLARNLEDYSGLAQANYTKGVTYYIGQNWELAIACLEISVEQYEGLENKKGQAKVHGLWGLISQGQGDYEASENHNLLAVEILEEIQDSVMLATIYDNMCGLLMLKVDYNRALEFGIKGHKIREQINPEMLSSSYLNIGLVHYSMGNYTEALDHYLKALEEAKINKNDRDQSIVHANLGNLYKRIKQFDKARESMEWALNYQLRTKDLLGASKSYNNLGTLMKKQGKPEESLSYYLKSLELREEINSTAEIWFVLGNVGNAYLQKGDLDEAKVYFNRSLSSAQKAKNARGLGYIYLKLAEYHVLKNDLDSAIHYGLEGMEFKMTTGDLAAIQNGALTLSEIYVANGDFERALEQYKLYTIYSDSLINERSIDKFAEILGGYELRTAEKELELKNQRIQILNQKAQIAKADSELTKRRNFELILALILLIVVAVLIYFLQKYRNQKKQRNLMLVNIQTQEKLKIERLEKEAMNRELIQFSTQLSAKNELLEKLKTELQAFGERQKNNKEFNMLHLFKLVETNIGTEKDWEDFKMQFNKLHGKFLENVMEKYPNLSNAEQRLVVLLKLKMNSKLIAGMLGIAVDSVKKGRYRLRKKMEVPSDVTIGEFLDSL